MSSQNFLKLPSGHIVNKEQLLVIAHIGVGQYTMIFKGSNSGVNISAEDAELLIEHLQPFAIHAKEAPSVITAEVQTPRE